MLEWKIGEVRVRCVPEIVLDLPSVELLVGFDMDVLGAERSWIVPDHIAADGMLKVAIQTFVVESDGKVIIVDTCFGNDRNLPYEHMEPLQTAFLDDLAARGSATRSRRRRAVHAPALRPRRVEHPAGRRPLGARRSRTRATCSGRPSTTTGRTTRTRTTST